MSIKRPHGYQRVLGLRDSYEWKYSDPLLAGLTFYSPALHVGSLFNPAVSNLIFANPIPVAGHVLDFVGRSGVGSSSAGIEMASDMHDPASWIPFDTWAIAPATTVLKQGYRLPDCDFLRFFITAGGLNLPIPIFVWTIRTA